MTVFTFTATQDGKSVAAPKRRNGHLAALNLTKKSQLSKEAMHFYLLYKKELKDGRRKSKVIKSLVRKKKTCKQQAIDYLTETLPLHSVEKIKRQIELHKKQPRGRRYSMDEKLFVSTVAKGGTRAVQAIKKHLIVPTLQTSSRLIRDITLKTGFNPRLLRAFAQLVQRLSSRQDKCFHITWDEMEITKFICWNTKMRCFQGYEDFGSLGRNPKACNQVLIVMAVNVKKKIKVPIAYFFAHKSTPARIITPIIREAVTRLHDAGARIVAGVCDQAPTNKKAMQMLGATEEKPFCYVDGKKMILMNDPPHVGKRIASMFRKYIVKLGDEKYARIEHVAKILVEKAALCGTTLAPKLKKKHLSASGKWAMRVYLAFQLLSRSIAAAINTLMAMGILEAAAAHTSQFILTMDGIIDSFNGSQQFSVKPLKAK